jgi:hypothetical protein
MLHLLFSSKKVTPGRPLTLLTLRHKRLFANVMLAIGKD